MENVCEFCEHAYQEGENKPLFCIKQNRTVRYTETCERFSLISFS